MKHIVTIIFSKVGSPAKQSLLQCLVEAEDRDTAYKNTLIKKMYTSLTEEGYEEQVYTIFPLSEIIGITLHDLKFYFTQNN